MAEITNINATTELQAVNEMLSAIGEAPLSSLGSGHPDEDSALETLRNHTRELQTRAWKFNAEHDLQLAPDKEDFAWTDPDGSTVTLNIWEVPSGLGHWKISAVDEQRGSKHIDVIARPSKQYTKSGNAVQVFYDRDYNRDGFPADERDYLWIDAVWYFDFEDLPELARRLITARAAREFAADVVGSEKLVRFSERSLQRVTREFLREYSQTDSRNVFRHPERRKFLGRNRGFPQLHHRKNRRG